MSKKKKRKLPAVRSQPTEVVALQGRIIELERRLKNQPTVQPRGGFTAYEQTFFQNMSAQNYTPENLREIYKKSPTIRFCVDTITRQILDMGWELRGENASLVERVNDWLKRPNSGNDAFDSVLNQMLFDLLIIDRGIVLKVFNAADQLVELFARDGATFYPMYDPFGALHGYVQKFVQQGKVQTIPFELREIAYFQAFPKTYSIPGFPIIESIVTEIAALLYGANWFARAMSGEEIPLGVLRLGKIGQEAYERARASFNPQTEGQQIPHKLRVLDNIDDAEWISFGQQNAQDLQASQLFDFLEKIILRSFGIVPPELSFGQGTVKGLRLRNSSLAEPLARYVARILNQEIFAQWGLEFRFKSRPAFAAVDLIQMVRGGLITPNEARDIIQFDPIEGGDELQVMTPTGLLGLGGGGGFGNGGMAPHPITSPQEQEADGGEEHTNRDKAASAKPHPLPEADDHQGEVFERRYKRKHWSEWKVGVPHPGFQAFDKTTYKYAQSREKLTRKYRATIMPIFERFQSKVFELTFGDTKEFSRASLPFSTHAALQKEITQETNKMLEKVDAEMWRYFGDAKQIGKIYAEDSVRDWGATEPIKWDDKELDDKIYPILFEKRRWVEEIMLKHVNGAIQTHYQPVMEEEEKQAFLVELSQQMTKAMFNLTAYMSVLGAVSIMAFLGGVEYFNRFLTRSLPQVMGGYADALGESRIVVWSAVMDGNTCKECRDLHNKTFDAVEYAEMHYGMTCCNGNCRCKIEPIARKYSDDSQLISKVMQVRELVPDPSFNTFAQAALPFSKEVMNLIQRTKGLQKIDYFTALPIIKMGDVQEGVLRSAPGGFELVIPRGIPKPAQIDILASGLGRQNYRYLASRPSASETFYPRMEGFARAVRVHIMDDIISNAKKDIDTRLIGEFLKNAPPKTIDAFAKEGFFARTKLDPTLLSSNEELFTAYFKTMTTNYGQFVELPAARAFQEMIAGQIWGPEQITRYLDYTWKKVLPTYGWKPNFQTDPFLRTWDKKLTKYAADIGLTPDEHTAFLGFMKKFLDENPLMRRKEFFEYMRRIGPLTKTLSNKHKSNYGLSSITDAYFIEDRFIAAHEIGQHVFRRYFLEGHPDAIRRFATVYELGMQDWKVRMFEALKDKYPDLAKAAVNMVDARRKELLVNPALLAKAPTAEQRYLISEIANKAATEIKVRHWMRPYCMFNIEEFFAEMFAYYTIYPVNVRSFALDIADEFGNLIDEFVFGVRVKIDGKWFKVPKKKYYDTYFAGLRQAARHLINKERQAVFEWRYYEKMRLEQIADEYRGIEIPKEYKISHQKVNALKRKALDTRAEVNAIMQTYGLSTKEAQDAAAVLYELRYHYHTARATDLARRARLDKKYLDDFIDGIKTEEEIVDFYRELMKRVDKFDDDLPDLGYGEGWKGARDAEDVRSTLFGYSDEY